MFITQGKINIKYFSIVILLVTIVVGVIIWNYWSTLKEKELLTEKPQEKEMVGLDSREYRREMIIDGLKNTESLKNFQISLELDTLSLIREGKLSFDCGNIKFTDSDKKTEIPYWIKGNCGEKDTEIWLRVPEILPDTNKVIYLYYGSESKPSASNFDEVFKTNDNLLGWYFFNKLEVTDLSINKNNGKISGLNYALSPATMMLSCENENGCFAFLDNWGVEAEYTDINDAYFEIPSKGLDFDKARGSIELWIKPNNARSGKYQRLLVDANREIELGINPTGDLYFYPAQTQENNYNAISGALKNDEWNHIIVTWNFESKEVIFYINGEKKRNDVDNVSRYWKKTAQTGDWQLGGTSLDIESAFVGYIDGLRIYNKALDNREARVAHQHNARNSRFPTISFGKEESIFDPSLIGNISSTDKINLGIFYATPLHEGYRWVHYPSRGEYIDPSTGDSLFLISKHEDDYIPAFGVPSHFEPYEGTPVVFKDSFLLSYVGLKINNPELIKDLKIVFKKIESHEYGMGQYFEKLIPTAYATGFSYSYKIVGDSYFSFIEENDGVYWYKLKNPIFIDQETTMMQLYYKPSGQEGTLSIQVNEMVFIDKDKNYIRPSFTENLIEWWHRVYSPTEEYLAYFAKEEMGFVVFKQDQKTQELVMSFENHGKDLIDIDDESIRNIKTQSLIVGIEDIIEDIKVQDLNDNVIYRISMDEIRKQMLGKKIDPGQSIKIPLISLKDLQKNTSYYITVGTGEKYNPEPNQKRIIRWIFGNNPFYYPRHRRGTDLYLYRLNVDRDGSFGFEEIRSR